MKRCRTNAAGVIVTWSSLVMREALELYMSGLGIRKVAAALKERYSPEPAPSHESVHQWAKAAGILRSKTRSDEMYNALRFGRDYDGIRVVARRLRAELNWSVRGIAENLGVSRKMIQRALGRRRDTPAQATRRRRWMAHHPDVERRRADYARAVELRAKGWSYPKIARELGRPCPTVYAWFRRDLVADPQRSGRKTSVSRWYEQRRLERAGQATPQTEAGE